MAKVQVLGLCPAAGLWQAIVLGLLQEGYKRRDMVTPHHGWQHSGSGYLYHCPANLLELAQTL